MKFYYRRICVPFHSHLYRQRQNSHATKLVSIQNKEQILVWIFNKSKNISNRKFIATVTQRRGIGALVAILRHNLARVAVFFFQSGETRKTHCVAAFSLLSSKIDTDYWKKKHLFSRRQVQSQKIDAHLLWQSQLEIINSESGECT